jgi:hypothetical protein
VKLYLFTEGIAKHPQPNKTVTRRTVYSLAAKKLAIFLQRINNDFQYFTKTNISHFHI